MRIRTFTHIVNNCASPHILNGSTLVIDAHRFFYNFYEEAGLRYEFGAESDCFAKYLKKYLSMFKDANVTCYFVFLGGTENMDNKIAKSLTKGEKHNQPIFFKEICKEVLDEMAYEYVTSAFGHKQDCIALARRLSCPVLSMDIEYSFSGVDYVPMTTLIHNEHGNILSCRLFRLESLYQNFKINKEKLAFFLILADSQRFPEGYFRYFFNDEVRPYQEIMRLMTWLSAINSRQVFKIILKNTKLNEEYLKIELEKAKTQIDVVPNCGTVTNYLLNKSTRSMSDSWFELGVAMGYIPATYVDLYRHNIKLGSWMVAHPQAEDCLRLSLNIVKYAQDLLTNFQNNGYRFISKYSKQEMKEILVENSIVKPYQVNSNIFEEGWDNIRHLGLFQHFLTEELKLDFDILENIPPSARLLMISLVYFSVKKSAVKTKEAYSIILCYVVLGGVTETVESSVTTINSISLQNCISAKKVLAKYFDVGETEMLDIRDNTLLHSLFEFQHCLNELNNLNRLCGLPFEPTIYIKSYNGTFVYNMLHSMQSLDAMEFFEMILSSAPTVLSFAVNIFSVYDTLMSHRF